MHHQRGRVGRRSRADDRRAITPAVGSDAETAAAERRYRRGGDRRERPTVKPAPRRTRRPHRPDRADGTRAGGHDAARILIYADWWGRWIGIVFLWRGLHIAGKIAVSGARISALWFLFTAHKLGQTG